MATYTGKSVTLPFPTSTVYEKISDLSQYNELIEKLPDDQRQKLNGVEFNSDSISMNAPSVGKLTFKINERTPATLVNFTAENCPMPLDLTINLKADGESATILTPAIKIEIPPMLRPFIGNKIQEAADKFGEVFTSIFK